MSSARSRRHAPVLLALVAILVLLVLAETVGRISDSGNGAAADVPPSPADSGSGSAAPGAPAQAMRAPYVVEASPALELKTSLPGGGLQVFGHHRFLVAYYGTAQTGAMGVLGATDPDAMQRRLDRAARPFGRTGEQVQPVYELIVTIADRSPGPDRDYSHDIPRALVERYLRAAHRHGALLLLDLQTGRAPFPEVAKRWAWALQDPWVGLALDPEWRMGPHQVPAHVVGSVRAREVNQTSLWLSRLVRDRGCRRSCSCSTSSGSRCCPTCSGSSRVPGWPWSSMPTASAPAGRSSRPTTRSRGRSSSARVSSSSTTGTSTGSRLARYGGSAHG